MAKSRRSSRRASRRVRKTRGRKYGGRRATTRRNGLFSRVYSPVNQAFGLANNVVNAAQSVVRKGVVGPARNLGRKIPARLNAAVSGVLHGKGRKNRKSRRNTRKNRRN